MNSSPSIAVIAPAFLKAQKNIEGAVKDSRNPFFKSNYADLATVIDSVLPILHNEGISVLQPIATVFDGKSVVRTVLMHESGEWISSDTDIVCSKVNDPQAYGSAITYARRYGLAAMVSLKQLDDDGETAMGRGNSRGVALPAGNSGNFTRKGNTTAESGSSDIF